jgi:hypothetical protein
MVCANCGSGSHRSNHASCTKHCTLCRADGHRQNTAACRFRECSKCKAVGNSTRKCTGSVNREAESSFAESSDLSHGLRDFPIAMISDKRMNDAERCSDNDDADATACAMHVDNASDGRTRTCAIRGEGEGKERGRGKRGKSRRAQPPSWGKSGGL